ncbi:unnamed protein product [Cuscuta campestris]|uniref:CCHC-type domain-containing protein n=1 Tax=Cuscuta campestris TaxID=132261 RepID=A0A484KYR8_9ASTE|nr:unnamed protein product [Cuscuta campestris]
MMLKKGAKKNTPLKCYVCGEIGHIKPMCPKLKNKKDKRAPKKQRAYISWENDGSGSEDSEMEEVANLCLMAIEDGETSKEGSKPNQSEIDDLTTGGNTTTDKSHDEDRWNKDDEAESDELEDVYSDDQH